MVVYCLPVHEQTSQIKVWAHGKYNAGLVNSVQVIEFAICRKSVPFTEKTWLQNVKTGIKQTEHGNQPVKCM